MIITPDAQKIVSLSAKKGKVTIWNLSGQKVTDWDEPENQGIQDLAMSPNGKYIVTINNKGNSYIWDFSGKQIAKVQSGVIEDILKFSPDSQYIVLASKLSTTIKFFNLSGQKTKDFIINDGGTIYRVC